MKLKTTLHIGMNDKDSHKQEYGYEFFIRIIGEQFSSCTILDGLGIWNNEKESTLIVIVYKDVEDIGKYKDSLRHKVEYLKTELNQEAILVHIELVDFELM